MIQVSSALVQWAAVSVLVQIDQGAHLGLALTTGASEVRQRGLIVVVDDILNGCRRAQQTGEVFWWAVVVVVVDFVSLLESFDASLVIFQVIRLGDRTEGSFATTTESVKVMNVRDVLLLRVRLLLVVMMVPFGSDGDSDVGLGSTDRP